MRRQIINFTIILFVLFLTSPLFAAQDKPQGMPPAQVVVAEVTAGMIAHESEFIGTVYYKEVSDVASDVSGKVEVVNFEEGERVKKGHMLVKLSSDLLKKTLQAARADYERILSDLKKAKKDLMRAEALYKEELLSEESYDGKIFSVESLEKKSASLQADVERLEAELYKKAIRAPFEGIVVQKHVDRGEWLFAGSTVATIAGDTYVDIIAEVPGSIIRHIKKGMETKIIVGGDQISGKIIAVIPRGDISTRTFPVKIRAINSLSLAEGMEARVTLPIGEKEKTFTVPRDAVITVYGNTVVYTVNDSKAVMVPVRIAGYEKMHVGIHGNGLKEGMKVIVKGNERLRPGQPVIVQN